MEDTKRGRRDRRKERQEEGEKGGGEKGGGEKGGGEKGGGEKGEGRRREGRRGEGKGEATTHAVLHCGEGVRAKEVEVDGASVAILSRAAACRNWSTKKYQNVLINRMSHDMSHKFIKHKVQLCVWSSQC